jgi:hypothetical protein
MLALIAVLQLAAIDAPTAPPLVVREPALPSASIDASNEVAADAHPRWSVLPRWVFASGTGLSVAALLSTIALEISASSARSSAASSLTASGALQAQSRAEALAAATTWAVGATLWAMLSTGVAALFTNWWPASSP